jgi:hypothetical protein
MAFKSVENDSAKRVDDLPWCNEYLTTYSEEEAISRVDSIIPTDKGCLVLCQDFKGMLFRGSTIYSFIQEAIPVWKKEGKLIFGVFASAKKGKKGLSLGTDDEYSCTVNVSKEGRVDFKYEDTEEPSTAKTENPFLKHTISSPPTTRARTSKKAEPPQEEIRY